jgi:hypothetical protein
MFCQASAFGSCAQRANVRLPETWKIGIEMDHSASGCEPLNDFFRRIETCDALAQCFPSGLIAATSRLSLFA